MANPLILWLQETLNRLFIKQPKYFKYWTYLSYFGMAICGIPFILTSLHIELPEPFATFSSKFISGMAVMMFWMSKLVVKTPVVGATTEGQAVQVTSKGSMPFTSKTEAEDVDKSQPPIEVLPSVPETPPDK